MAIALDPSATLRLPKKSAGAHEKLYKGETLQTQDDTDISVEYQQFTTLAFQQISTDYGELIGGSLTLSTLLSELNRLAFDKGYGGRSNLEDRAIPGKYRYEYEGDKEYLQNVSVNLNLKELDKKSNYYPIDVGIDYDFIHLNPEEIKYLQARKINPSDVEKFDIGTLYFRGLKPVTNRFPFGYMVIDHQSGTAKFYYANAREIPNLISYASSLILKLDKMEPVTKAELENFNKSRENNKHVYEVLGVISHIYRCLIVSHPFLTINNSLIMILINFLLSEKGF